MYNESGTRTGTSFPNPLASPEEKASKGYGLQYAKAIESQWGHVADRQSVFKRRHDIFDKNRKYANGTQDTTIYKKLLTGLDNNASDGTLLNLDFTPVPILPKFVRVVTNNVLSKSPYPNVEAIDPLSSSEKDKKKKRLEAEVKAKKQLEILKEESGLIIKKDPSEIPDTLEEAEIFMGTNIKTDAEIAAQLGINLTLNWSDFFDSTFRRCVNDVAICGMAVVKRHNDPNYGIVTEYVDPSNFVHSFTDDPSFKDLSYAGHIKKITIQELKRLAGDDLTEEDFAMIAKSVAGKHGNNASNLHKRRYDDMSKRNVHDYDEYLVEVLDFEYKSVECIYFEEKENRFGNSGFYFKGFEYREKPGSVFKRTPYKMEVECVYGGSYVLNTKHLFGYGKKMNIPKNAHDISKAKLSYSVSATNLRDMVPKSMVDSCIGFADMLQITHLKLQQAIAKAKPDGLIIDIEGLENVQLGKAGELQPLDLHDIYEQTGVFYYRSKNPEGGFQNPPIREIGNSIRNINELIGLYNHYLRLIRDTTGINEVTDGSTPKTDALVGVREQAIQASNNATYDITDSSMTLFKQVCQDVVKCLQILPMESVLFKVYENAVGEENMKVLSSFSDLKMYNFGVTVVKEMEQREKAEIEQMIQISLGQKEIDLEDAMAIRDLKDVNQAERLLIVRRKKRKAEVMQQQQQMAQQQQQMAMQQQQASAQVEAQKLQAQAQLEAQKIQLKAQSEIQVAQALHEMRKEIEIIKAQATLGFKEDDQQFREKLETFKEDRKDKRVTKQAVEQSKLMSQRKGERGPVQDDIQPNLMINR